MATPSAGERIHRDGAYAEALQEAPGSVVVHYTDGSAVGDLIKQEYIGIPRPRAKEERVDGVGEIVLSTSRTGRLIEDCRANSSLAVVEAFVPTDGLSGAEELLDEAADGDLDAVDVDDGYLLSPDR